MLLEAAHQTHQEALVALHELRAAEADIVPALFVFHLKRLDGRSEIKHFGLEPLDEHFALRASHKEPHEWLCLAVELPGGEALEALELVLEPQLFLPDLEVFFPRGKGRFLLFKEQKRPAEFRALLVFFLEFIALELHKLQKVELLVLLAEQKLELDALFAFSNFLFFL